MQFFKKAKASSAEPATPASHASSQPSLHKDDESEKRQSNIPAKTETDIGVTSSAARQLSTDTTDSAGNPKVATNETALEKKIEGIEADAEVEYPSGMNSP